MFQKFQLGPFSLTEFQS